MGCKRSGECSASTAQSATCRIEVERRALPAAPPFGHSKSLAAPQTSLGTPFRRLRHWVEGAAGPLQGVNPAGPCLTAACRPLRESNAAAGLPRRPCSLCCVGYLTVHAFRRNAILREQVVGGRRGVEEAGEPAVPRRHCPGRAAMRPPRKEQMSRWAGHSQAVLVVELAGGGRAGGAGHELRLAGGIGRRLGPQDDWRGLLHHQHGRRASTTAAGAAPGDALDAADQRHCCSSGVRGRGGGMWVGCGRGEDRPWSVHPASQPTSQPAGRPASQALDRPGGTH